MSSAEDRAWAEANLPVLGKYCDWWKEPNTDALSMGRQQIIMQEGNVNARLWLALQSWADEGLRIKFVAEEERKTVLSWWEYQKTRDFKWGAERDVIVRLLAEKGIDLGTMAKIAKTERAQLNIWEYIKKHMRINEAQRMAAYTLGQSEYLRPSVRAVMIEYIRDSINKGVELEVVEVLGDENIGIGGALAGSKVVQLRVNKTRKTEKEAISNLELVKDTVDGLIGSNYLGVEELAQIVELCLPHGSWFMHDLLNRKIDVLDPTEAEVVNKAWAGMIERCRDGRDNHPDEWPDEYGEYSLSIRKMLSVMARTREHEWLNQCVAEGIEYFPREVIGIIKHWPDGVLKNINPKTLAGAIKSDNRHTREDAIGVASRIGKIGVKKKSIGA